jgi:GGDEF domain-containing protein
VPETLNERARAADTGKMTIAPDAAPIAGDSAVADATTLLPTRDAVLARLTEQLPATERTPACLLVIGLLRGADGRPTPPGPLAEVTRLFASSLRADDWLASSGPGEFVVLMSGPAVGGRVAADRLVTAVAGLGVPDLAAAAGVAPLTALLSAGEVLRRATVSLTAARRVGACTVVQYREPY